MYLYYCVNGVEQIKFQVCIVPFFINTNGAIQLPYGYLEAESFFRLDCKKELQKKIDDQPKELRVKSMPYVWVERQHKPTVLFFHDSGISSLQSMLHNAISVANTRGVNIAMFLFRSNFGMYYTRDETIIEVTIEECREFLFGRPDMDIHVLLSSKDKAQYQLLKDWPIIKEECAPNFDS